ncbi:MAG: hypothetical protein AB8B55_21155 [Mariniblastus sp.]
MFSWKSSAIFFAALSFLVVAVSYFILDARSKEIARAAEAVKSQGAELATLREAANDTQSMLNWYRINTKEELDEEDYERSLDLLVSRYVRHFPKWAQ